MKRNREKPTPPGTHPPVSGQAALYLDPEWEVIGKDGVPRLPGAFGEFFEAVEATETSAPVARSQHDANPVASPPDSEATPSPFDYENLMALQSKIDESLSHPTRSQPGFDTSPHSIDVELLMATQPKGDEPLLNPAPWRQAKRSQGPRPHDDSPPAVPSSYTQTLAEHASKGAEFILWDHSVLTTSIPKVGGRLSKRIVQWALRKITCHFKYRSLCLRRQRVSRIQQLMLRFAEVLAFHDQVHPGIPGPVFSNDALIALTAVLDGLDEISNAKMK